MSTQFRDTVMDSGREARRGGTSIKILLKRGTQVFHILVGVGFLLLAIVEFFRNPPYFDVIKNIANDSTIPPQAFYVRLINRINFLPCYN